MSAGRFTKGEVVNGKYEIHGVLGQGGFGVVYLIRMLDTGEAFAMKTFRDERMADIAAQEAFKKEAMLWVNLERHPCIVAAQWVELVSGRLFVLMEHIAADPNGRVTLADYLADPSGSLDTIQALEWGIQFCLGMEHAQARGIKCHRDIKPGNILIAQGATLKISDFGLAVAAQSVWRGDHGQGDSALNGGADVAFRFSVIETEGKMRCGTPGYMPPEVYRGEGADIRSDIYSFGLVLWQMVTRNPRPPFAAPWRGDAEAYLRGTYEQQMRERAPLADGLIAAVINRCLHPKPQNRYGSFQELRGDLLPLYEQSARRKFQIPTVGEKTATFWNNKGGSLAALKRYEEAIRCYDTALAIDPRAAQIWNNKGSALSALGRIDEAAKCFDQALVIQPRFAMALANKARELMVCERHQDALECYDRALAINQNYAEAWQGKGVILTQLERQEEAIRCFDKALALDSKLAHAWHNRGLSLLALQRDSEALECFDQALAINPRLDIALDRKAVTLAALERYAEALPCFEQALALAPDNANSWFILAQCRWATGDIEGQIAALNEALVLNPADEKPLVCLVQTLVDRGRYDEAIAACGKLKTLPSASGRFACEDIWVTKAHRQWQDGKLDEALLCFNQAVVVNPTNMKLWCNRGVALKALGRLNEAVASYDKALELDPRDVKTWFNKANALAAQEKYREALVCFQEAHNLGDPNAAKYVEQCQRLLKGEKGSEDSFERGCAYYQAGDFEEAIRCYDAALAADGKNPDILINNGAALLALNRELEAVACFEKVISLQPQNAAAWNNKGRALQGLGRLDEALSAFDKASVLNPRHANAWFGKGEVLMRLGRHQDAIVCFENVVKLNPADVQGWFAKAVALEKLGKHTEAVSCYEEGLKLQPGFAAAWFNMGHCMGLLGRHEDVVKCCDRALQLNPNDSQNWKLKGLGLFSMERYQDAIPCFQQAERLGDASAADHIAECRKLLFPVAERYFITGSGYQQEGRNADAIACYEKGLAIDPSKDVIWSNMGAALLALKRNAEAVTCFERAIALQPNDWGAWNNKGIALFFMEQYAAALPALEEAQRLGATRCGSMIAVCRDKLGNPK